MKIFWASQNFAAQVPGSRKRQQETRKPENPCHLHGTVKYYVANFSFIGTGSYRSKVQDTALSPTNIGKQTRGVRLQNTKNRWQDKNHQFTKYSLCTEKNRFLRSRNNKLDFPHLSLNILKIFSNVGKTLLLFLSPAIFFIYLYFFISTTASASCLPSNHTMENQQGSSILGAMTVLRMFHYLDWKSVWGGHGRWKCGKIFWENNFCQVAVEASKKN